MPRRSTESFPKTRARLMKSNPAKHMAWPQRRLSTVHQLPAPNEGSRLLHQDPQVLRDRFARVCKLGEGKERGRQGTYLFAKGVRQGAARQKSPSSQEAEVILMCRPFEDLKRRAHKRKTRYSQLREAPQKPKDKWSTAFEEGPRDRNCGETG